MDFNGKVVLITGSSSGIGEGTAIKFASLGANVVITGRDDIKIKNVAQKCREITKEKVLEVRADLTIDSEVEYLLNETINEFDRLDILVNNAGIAPHSSITDPNLIENFDIVMNTNVRSVLFLTSLSVPYLEKSKGVIVNVSSNAGFKPFPSMMTYCASKSALDMITKCLALELGPKGIRINSINPGLTRTPILNYGSQTVNDFENICKAEYPLRRIGETEDVANAIAFVSSEKASFITGSVIPVDGGSANCAPFQIIKNTSSYCN